MPQRGYYIHLHKHLPSSRFLQNAHLAVPCNFRGCMPLDPLGPWKIYGGFRFVMTGTPSYHPFRTMGFSPTKTNHFGVFLWFSYGFPMVWGTFFKRFKGLIYHMEPNSLGNAFPLSCPCFRFFKRRGYFLCAPESSLAVSTKWPERTITLCI